MNQDTHTTKQTGSSRPVSLSQFHDSLKTKPRQESPQASSGGARAPRQTSRFRNRNQGNDSRGGRNDSRGRGPARWQKRTGAESGGSARIAKKETVIDLSSTNDYPVLPVKPTPSEPETTDRVLPVYGLGSWSNGIETIVKAKDLPQPKYVKPKKTAPRATDGYRSDDSRGSAGSRGYRREHTRHYRDEWQNDERDEPAWDASTEPALGPNAQDAQTRGDEGQESDDNWDDLL